MQHRQLGMRSRRRDRQRRLPSSAQVRDWTTIGTPKLPARVKKYLRQRGISREVWQLNNVRFLRPRQTAALWGPQCYTPAILFPFSKRFASARLLGRKGSDRFRTPDGVPVEIYVPVLPKSKFKNTSISEARENPKRTLIIGEGVTRTLAAISRGKLAITITSCWTWQKDREPKAELKRWNWKGRKVIPVFDADISQNLRVLWPFVMFGDWLTSQGARVKFVELPRVAGDHTGLDDFFAIEGAEGFDALPFENWRSSERLEELRLSATRATEGGLAELLVQRHGDNLRHDSDQRRWFWWNGVLWQPEGASAAHVQENAKEVVAWIIEEAARVPSGTRRKAMLKWAQLIDKRNAISGAMSLASSNPRIQVRLADLDTDQYLLGTQSGIVDLKVGKLCKGLRRQLITRSVAAPYIGDAQCPNWRRFIKEVMCGKSDMIEFIQRLVGYILIGGNPERLIFFLYGIGRNGKSVFIETLLKLLGDYGHPAKSELLMTHRLDRDSESAQPFLLQFNKIRLATASEVKEGMTLDAGVVKSLTGQDEITVRGLRAAPVRFTIEAIFLIRCNFRPRINSEDVAIWDRVVEVPFDLRVSDEQQDKDLRSKLFAELPGILQWGIDGALAYQKDGLRLPELVRSQTSAYRESMDSVSGWLEDNTERGPRKRVETQRAYFDYDSWCDSHSINGTNILPVSKKEFHSRMKARNFKITKTNGKRVWRGLTILG